MRFLSRRTVWRAFAALTAASVTAIAPTMANPAQAMPPGNPPMHSVCAMLPGHVLQRYAGTGTSWNTIAYDVSDVYSGPYGLFATFRNKQGLYQYTGTPPEWVLAGPAEGSFVVTGWTIYNLREDGIYRYYGPERWTRFGPPAQAIYGGPMYDLVAVSATGDVSHYDGYSWQSSGTGGGEFALSFAGIFRMDAEYLGVPVDTFAIGSYGYPYIRRNGEVFRYERNVPPADWPSLGTPDNGTELAINDDAIITGNPFVINWYDRLGTSWRQIGYSNLGIWPCR